MESYDKWRIDPTPDNMADVIDELSPVINSEIHRYPGSKPILRGRAKTLAIEAVRRFDPERATNLKSWVVTSMQPLYRYGNQSRPIGASEMMIRQSAELARVRQELADEIGREPDDAELADATGIPVKRIASISAHVKPTVYDTAFDSTDEGGIGSLPGTVSGHSASSAAQLVRESLSERDRMIYDLKTGAPLVSNTEIARRLGVSPAYVSQRGAYIAGQIASMAR